MGAVGLVMLGFAARLSPVTTWAVVLVTVAAAFSGLGGVRAVAAAEGLLARAAAEGAAVEVEGTVTSDPRAVQSAWSSASSFRVKVRFLESRGERRQARDEAVLLAAEVPKDLALGARVRARVVPLTVRNTAEHRSGRTAWKVVGRVEVVQEPDVWWRGAAAVRASLRQVVSDRPDDQRALVPSLVVGDDALVAPDLADAFRTTGLTHLLAVSGTNLTLLAGVVLWVGRRCGVRGRGRMVLMAFCIAGFVLVARSEPSVVRAATMGAVAVFALERNGTDRGLRCLALAVVVLLAWNPWMATSVGLALSVLATAGILLLAPGWAEHLSSWMPRWAALALTVPAAAQLACTPVVAAVSGEVSLVAVLANVAAAPAVAPATVLGLAGGMVGLVHDGVGAGVALPAAWSVGWIAAVARWGSELPVPAFAWPVGVPGIAALTILCVAVAVASPWVLRRPWLVVPPVLLVLWVVLRGVPMPGWPPDGWLVVACDVGQGDAVVVRTGERAAMVVDVGPEPRAVRRCLDRLGVERVDRLVLSHFHADHVDGLEGVVGSRPVAGVEVSPVDDPEDRAVWVRDVLAEHGLVAEPSRWGTRSRVGEVTVHRIWPEPASVEAAGTASAGEAANDTSVVLLVEAGGVRILFTGDVEPPAQARLAKILQGQQVDVLKVPHHGSRHQDDRFLAGLAPRVVLVSSGAENTYGHPSPELVERLGRGAEVLRTDTASDVAVVLRDGELGTSSLR